MSIEVNQRLMFVGLGGTGIKITSELEAMLRREMCGPDGTFITKKYPNLELRPYELPQFIQTVVIDTDAAAVAEHRSKFQSENDDIYFNTTTQIKDLSVSKSYGVVAEGLRAQMPEDVKQWLPKTENEPNVAPISAGAGQFPLVGRAALFNALQPDASSFLSNFDKAIKNIATSQGDLALMGPKSGPSKDLYIYVAFSVAGGTGTGIYYDILHLLDEKVRNELSDLNTYIFPLVLLPKAFEDAQLESAYRYSKLNGGFAISDLAQLVDQQRSQDEKLSSKFTQVYPGDLKIKIGGLQDSRSVIRAAFTFTKGPNADIDDMYRSVAAFCLSNLDGDLDKDASGEQLSFFSDLINRNILDAQDSAGVGKRPLVPATGARLTIPVENIANFISTYFVADAIRNASNDALYKNEDREEIINSILRTTNLDFVHNENNLPEEFSLPNKPKKPTNNKEAKDYARKVISSYQDSLGNLETRIKTEVSNRLTNIRVSKIVSDVLKQNNEFDIFQILRALIGLDSQENSVLSELNSFTQMSQPSDKWFKVPARLNKKNFENWFAAFEKDIKNNQIPYLWAKTLLNDALFSNNVLGAWQSDVNDFRREIDRWVNSQGKDLTKENLKQEAQGELVKEFLPQLGSLPVLYNSLISDFENEPNLSELTDIERLTKIINASAHSWSEILESVAGDLSQLGQKVVDTVEGALAGMLEQGVKVYFDETQDTKPLVPNLKQILFSTKNQESLDGIMKTSLDQLQLELAGLIGPGGIPDNSKYDNDDYVDPTVRVTYPADVRDDEIESWIEKQLSSGALGALKKLNWEYSTSQGNSIVVAFVITSHGVLGNKDSFECLRLAYESNLTNAGVDKIPWRKRLGTTHTQIIGDELSDIRSFVRLFLSLYTGQGEFRNGKKSIKSIEDFKEIDNFVFKESKDAPELVIPMIENLTDICIPTFADSLLKFQFDADMGDLIIYSKFNGTAMSDPVWLKEGKPPKPKKQFNFLINEIREQEIKKIKKDLSKDLPSNVILQNERALDFWENKLDKILNSSIVPEEASGNQFNTLQQLVDFTNK